MPEKGAGLVQCGGLTLAEHQVLTKAILFLLSSTGQGRENTRKGSCIKLKAKRDHSPIIVMGKTGLTLGNYFNLSPIKFEYDNEVKKQIIKHLPLTPPSFPSGLNFILGFQYLLCSSSTRGQGMRAVISSSQAVRATPSYSEGGLITALPCSSVGSLPWGVG